MPQSVSRESLSQKHRDLRRSHTYFQATKKKGAGSTGALPVSSV